MKVLVLRQGNDFDYHRIVSLIKNKYKDSQVSMALPQRFMQEYKGNDVFELLPFKTESYSIPFKEMLSLRKKIKEKKIDMVFLPEKEMQKKNIDPFRAMNLMLMGFFFKSCGIKTIKFFNSDENNNFESDFTVKGLTKDFLRRFLTLLFAPFIILLMIPFNFFKVILKQFILPKSTKNNEIIGYGAFKGMAGLVYFTTKVKMLKRFGTFGVACDDCMGLPVSLHRPPLDIIFLKFLGYKKNLLFSIIIISLGFFISIYSQHKDNLHFLYFLIPLVFLSTYFLRNVAIGHIEFLSWGFFILSLVFFLDGNIIISALFFSLLIYSHITVAILCFITIMAIESYNILTNFNDAGTLLSIIINLVIYGLIVISITGIFLYPFFKSRNKLSRGELINSHYGWVGRWNFKHLSQEIIFFMILFSGLLANNFTFGEIDFILTVPLIALYINTKKRWIFSEYTIELLMLFTGFLYIIYNPFPMVIFFYLFFAFTSPALNFYGYYAVTPFIVPIHPVYAGNVKREVEKIVSSVVPGTRIALEGGPISTNSDNYHYNAHISYFMADYDNIELLNGYGPEFVEFSIYDKYLRHLDKNITEENLRMIMENTACHYILVYSSELKERLKKYGYEKILDSDFKTLVKKDEEGPIASLFKSPFKCSKILPEAELIIKPNEFIINNPEPGVQYFLKYNCYHGYKAYQGTKKIFIEDACPGMMIFSESDEKIVIKYSFKHYFN